jgi:hypothetical protein
VVAGLAGATAGYMHRTSTDAHARVMPVEHQTTVGAPWASLNADDQDQQTTSKPTLDPAEVAGEAGLGGEQSYY